VSHCKGSGEDLLAEWRHGLSRRYGPSVNFFENPWYADKDRRPHYSDHLT
jgi:hypothetical protein